ncbi:MAG: AI-2E family transporter [Candidatus Poribacteria bacterium]
MDEKTIKTDNHKEKVHFFASRQTELYLQIIAISSSIVVITIMFLLMYYIRQVLGVFVLSFLISYIISPLVKTLERRKINRTLSVGILYLAFVAITVVCIVVFAPMLWNEIIMLQFSIQDNLSNPEFSKNIMSAIEDFQEQLSEAIPMLKDIDLKSQFDVSNSVSNIASWILNYIGQMLKAITSYGTRIVWVIIYTFVIPFIVFFLLKDGGKLKQLVLQIVPSRYYDVSIDLLDNIDNQIGKFIRGKIAESIILSILTAIGLRILGIKYALLIGSIAGFANLIPYIGPVGIAIPPVLLGIYEYGIFHGIITAIFLSALQFVDNMVLVPFIVGKSVDLHPLVTMFVVFIGGKTLGLLGLVAAVPMASIIISISQVVYKEFNNVSSIKHYID